MHVCALARQGEAAIAWGFGLFFLLSICVGLLQSCVAPGGVPPRSSVPRRQPLLPQALC